jgi:hypothetical protein
MHVHGRIKHQAEPRASYFLFYSFVSSKIGRSSEAIPIEDRAGGCILNIYYTILTHVTYIDPVCVCVCVAFDFVCVVVHL